MSTHEKLHAALTELHRHPNCNVGGPLHIVTDDLNTETHHIVWCCVGAREWWVKYGGDDWWWVTLKDIIETIATELLAMPTEDAREAAIEAWWQRDRITPP